MSGSKLYQDAMAYYDANPTQDAALQHEVWDGTPWMVDAYTGNWEDGRERLMLLWCQEQFGPEAWPFSDTPRPGNWKRGGATVFGWSWFGFATEEQMKQFIEAWPAPEGVEHPTKKS